MSPSPEAPELPTLKRCSGCGRCVAACQKKLYTLDTVGRRKLAVKKSSVLCDNCLNCLPACPLELLAPAVTTAVN